MSSYPLVTDLDGTLLRSDILIESALVALKANPLEAFRLLWWLIRGKAYLKDQLARRVVLDIGHLPFDPKVIALIAEEKAKGRRIVLATASHKIFAEQIAKHLGLFDAVIATDGDVNLSASTKRDALVGEFGARGFDYVGNSMDDLAIWTSARRAYVANPANGVEAKVRALGNLEQTLHSASNPLRVWGRALRLHQWAKNLLIFVPLFASHRLADPALFLNSVLAFIVFGLCASSVYLLNDLLDLADDRRHATKRYRPFAAGQISIIAGLGAIVALLMSAFVGSALLLAPAFTFVLTAYFVLTTLYSFWLKRLVMVDVTTLALLYTLRIIAGAFAIDVILTFWLLAFSLFIFFSFALAKRYAELYEARALGITEKSHGRGYYPDDLEIIASLGVASGYISVLVLAFYIQDQSTVALYRHPTLIWPACPLLLYWISRAWLLTKRGQMHDDPVVFALTDRVSLLVGVMLGAVFWLAT